MTMRKGAKAMDMIIERGVLIIKLEMLDRIPNVVALFVALERVS
jgi:hypothetical protein